VKDDEDFDYICWWVESKILFMVSDKVIVKFLVMVMDMVKIMERVKFRVRGMVRVLDSGTVMGRFMEKFMEMVMERNPMKHSLLYTGKLSPRSFSWRASWSGSL